MKSVRSSFAVTAVIVGVGISPMILPLPAAGQNPVVSNLIPGSAQVTINARITAIDPATRAVTLLGANGNQVTLTAGPAVQLETLKVGDAVNVQYYRSVAFEVTPPVASNQAPVSNESLEQKIARGAQAPGGTAVRLTKVQATVVGIDLAAQNVDVINPSGGGVYTIHVIDPERVAKLQGLKVGDTITAVISQALAVSIAPASATSEAAQIDSDATAALARLYTADPRAKSLGSKAAAILIFPKIVKAGFIVGGQGGKGVLWIDGQPRGYYSIAAASFGLQVGMESFSYALFFMDRDALRYLDQSDGWALGTDPNVAVIDRGVGADLSSTTLAKRVIAFPFGEKGLMADLSLEGSKISTYRPNP